VRAVSGSALLADAGRSAPAPITHPWARRARLLAADAAVRGPDRDDLGSRANVDPTGRRRRLQRARERPGAAAGVDRRARRSPVGAGGVVEEDGRGAGRPRAHRREQHAARRERPPHRLVVEDLLHQVGHRHRQRPDGLAPGPGSQIPERLPQLQAHDRVGEGRRLRVGGRRDVHVGEEARDRPHLRVEPRERLGVVSVPVAQLGRRAGRIPPERHRRAVGLGREHAHGRRDGLEAVPLELQVPDHRCAQASDRVCDARCGHALDGRRGSKDASDPIGRLEQRDLPSGLGQVGRGDQAVVACTDHDDVGAWRH